MALYLGLMILVIGIVVMLAVNANLSEELEDYKFSMDFYRKKSFELVASNREDAEGYGIVIDEMKDVIASQVDEITELKQKLDGKKKKNTKLAQEKSSRTSKKNSSHKG